MKLLNIDGIYNSDWFENLLGRPIFAINPFKLSRWFCSRNIDTIHVTTQNAIKPKYVNWYIYHFNRFLGRYTPYSIKIRRNRVNLPVFNNNFSFTMTEIHNRKSCWLYIMFVRMKQLTYVNETSTSFLKFPNINELHFTDK